MKFLYFIDCSFKDYTVYLPIQPVHLLICPLPDSLVSLLIFSCNCFIHPILSLSSFLRLSRFPMRSSQPWGTFTLTIGDFRLVEPMPTNLNSLNTFSYPTRGLCNRIKIHVE